MVLKKGLLTELEKKNFSERQYFLGGRACFGWVGRSTAKQQFFKVRLKIQSNRNCLVLQYFAQLVSYFYIVNSFTVMIIFNH